MGGSPESQGNDTGHVEPDIRVEKFILTMDYFPVTLCPWPRGWNLSTTDSIAHREKSAMGYRHEESSLAIRAFKIHLVHAPKSWAGTDSNFLPGFCNSQIIVLSH